MFHFLLGAVIVPLVVSAGLLLIGGWRRRSECEPQTSWATPLALGGGCAAGFIVLFGPADIPPAQHWQWLLHLAPAAAIVGIAVARPSAPTWLRWGLAASIIPLAAWRLVPSFADLSETRGPWMAVAAGMIAANWLAIARMSGRGVSVAWTVGLVIAGIGAAGFMLIAGTVRFALMAGVLASAVAPGILATFRPLWSHDFRGVAPVLGLLTTGVALTGAFYHAGEVPLVGFVVVGSAPAIMGLATLLPARWPPWREGAAALLLVLFAIATALILGA